MEAIKCEKCERGFGTQDALVAHFKAKHAKPDTAKYVNKKSSILKYGILAVIIIVVAGVAFGQFGKNKAEAKPAFGSPTDFTLPSSNGDKISLSDYKGKKNVLLYFQEGVMCDPCWEQTRDIEKEYDKFKAMDIELLTITVDPLNAVTKNAKRFGITLPVLADEDLRVSKAYDVLKDAMHPGERPGHTFVLVDKTGKIIWRKAYFLASGSTKMTMKMGERTMTMDMGMDMGKPGFDLMYVPVDKLLEDLKSANIVSGSSSLGLSEKSLSDNEPMQDHTMCLTPIHNHVDFKMYLGGIPLNFSQNNYMDQSNTVHFHKTVKVNPDDVAGIPNGLIIHIHKEGISLSEFLETLDLPFNINGMKGLKVYANGNVKDSNLGYIMRDKDRILITDNDGGQIKSQIESVTDYALQGKEKNPALFGGC